MKTESDKWKLPVFIGSLVIVALLINYLFFARASTKQQAKAQQERANAAVVLGQKIAKENAEKLRKKKEEADRVAADKKVAQEKADSEAKTAKDKADADAKAAKDKADADAKAAREQADRDAKAREEAERQKTIQEAAAEHTRFLARYLNAGIDRKPATAAVALAIASEGGTANFEIAEALMSRLQTNDVRLFSSFFKPEFVADGLAADIFRGRTDVFEKLELTNSLDAVLLGRQIVDYATNASVENIVTANVRLELLALPIGTAGQSQSWKFAANGVGIRAHEARTLAEQRLIQAIARDTNMLLAPTLSPRR